MGTTDNESGRIRVSELHTSHRIGVFVIPTEVEGSRAVCDAQAKTDASASPQGRCSEPCAEHRLRLARSLVSCLMAPNPAKSWGWGVADRRPSSP